MSEERGHTTQGGGVAGVHRLTEDDRRRLEKALRVVRRAAKRIAARFGGTVREVDLLGPGTMGLIGADQRFDPGRGSYDYYLQLRAEGEMLDMLKVELCSEAERLQLVIERAWNKQHRAELERRCPKQTYDEQDESLVDRSVQNEMVAAAAMANRTEVPAMDEEIERRESYLQAHEAFERAFDALRPTLRTIFEGYHGENKSVEELAEAHGCSVNTIRRRLEKAAGRLRNALRRQGFTHPPELVDLMQMRGPTSTMRPKAPIECADDGDEDADDDLDPPASSAQ
jgi:RNA polymerase sigma factor (sigma-70 family)